MDKDHINWYNHNDYNNQLGGSMVYNEISAMDLRKNLGGVLNQVSLQHQPFIVNRGAHPLAVLIDIDTFYEKVAPQAPKRSLREFAKNTAVDFKNFKFNRDEANER